MNLRWERFYPYVAGVSAGLLWWTFTPVFEAGSTEVLSASLTIGSILTGFLATSKAILLGLNEARIMNDLRRSGYIDDLVSYLAQAIFFSFSYAVVSLVGYFVNRMPIYWVMWVAIGVISALTFVRVVFIQLKILHSNPTGR